MEIHHVHLPSTPPTPTTPPAIYRRLHPLRRAEVVTVTSFADTSTAASTSSAGKSIPVGPIVGGIVAGVAVVLLVGGLWWWCHQKAVKERKERQARLKAKLSKSTPALSARPSLNPKESTTSINSMDKSFGHRNKGSGGLFAVPGAPLPSVGYDSRGAGKDREKSATPNGYLHPSSETSANVIQLAPVVAHDPLQVPSGSTVVSGPASPLTSSSRHRHERSLSKEPVIAAPIPSSVVHRYQPARPSPLALAAKSADDTTTMPVRGNSVTATSPSASVTGSGSREGSLSGSGVLGVKAEERKPDNAVPKWGQKPFRSAATPALNRTTSGAADAVEHVAENDDSEDEDPFEHSKYDRHRSTASTHVSSVAGSIAGKRDTVRQSRDRRDVMGGIAEWQDEVEVGVAYSPSEYSPFDTPQHNGYAIHTAHGQDSAYPYPPEQQEYELQNRRNEHRANGQQGDPFTDVRYRG